MTAPTDTTRAAFAVQIEQLRHAGPSARLAMAAEMSDAVLDLATASVRRRNPEYDDDEVSRVLIERLFGWRPSTVPRR